MGGISLQQARAHDWRMMQERTWTSMKPTSIWPLPMFDTEFRIWHKLKIPSSLYEKEGLFRFEHSDRFRCRCCPNPCIVSGIRLCHMHMIMPLLILCGLKFEACIVILKGLWLGRLMKQPPVSGTLLTELHDRLHNLGSRPVQPILSLNSVKNDTFKIYSRFVTQLHVNL